jgi:hypothetical protein
VSLNTEAFDRCSEAKYLEDWRNDNANEMRGSTTVHNRHDVPTADIVGDKKFLWKIRGMVTTV